MRTRAQAGCSTGTSTLPPDERRSASDNVVLVDSAQPSPPSGRLAGVFTLSTVTSETTVGSAATAYLSHLHTSAAARRANAALNGRAA